MGLRHVNLVVETTDLHTCSALKPCKSYQKRIYAVARELEGGMDTVPNIYSNRAALTRPLPAEVAALLQRLATSFRPTFRRPAFRREAPPVQNDNWRSNVLVEVARKVRDKDDPDYDEINAFINKVSKQTYEKLVTAIKTKLAARDAMFRLRITTLLFDRGIKQNFYAPILADVYSDIVKSHEDARQDLAVQIGMFDTLYDTSAVIIVPPSSDPTFNDVIIAWTKQKETKRGFAVYVSELFTRGLLPPGIMESMVRQVVDDMKESMRLPKTPPGEEHVDHLVRFLAAIAPKVKLVKELAIGLLSVPRAETPCLCMKSRFKLEDCSK